MNKSKDLYYLYFSFLVMDSWDKLDKFQKTKFLEAYQSKSGEISDILDDLTRSYCISSSCPGKKSIGCCNYDHYNTDVPNEFLVAQQFEALTNGWTNKEDACTYHSKEKGCYLTNFKNPLCLGQACQTLESAMITISKEYGSEFIRSMRSFAFTSIVINPSFVLKKMDDVIYNGTILKDLKSSK